MNYTLCYRATQVTNLISIYANYPSQSFLSEASVIEGNPRFWSVTDLQSSMQGVPDVHALNKTNVCCYYNFEFTDTDDNYKPWRWHFDAYINKSDDFFIPALKLVHMQSNVETNNKYALYEVFANNIVVLIKLRKPMLRVPYTAWVTSKLFKTEAA